MGRDRQQASTAPGIVEEVVMRPVLVIMATALIIGTAYHAWSSPNPKAETPLLGSQKPASVDHRCILKTTTQRFFIAPDGKMTYAGGFVIWMKCPSK